METRPDQEELEPREPTRLCYWALGLMGASAMLLYQPMLLLEVLTNMGALRPPATGALLSCPGAAFLFAWLALTTALTESEDNERLGRLERGLRRLAAVVAMMVMVISLLAGLVIVTVIV